MTFLWAAIEPEKLSAYELIEGLLPIVLSAQRLV
jgi:hypothetical protein